MERLRYVARSGPAPMEALVREAAVALAYFADDPPGMLTSCRRLAHRRRACGPLVWLAARMLAAADPRREARQAVREIGSDPTADVLREALPAGARVFVSGRVDVAAPALSSRPDLRLAGGRPGAVSPLPAPARRPFPAPARRPLPAPAERSLRDSAERPLPDSAERLLAAAVEGCDLMLIESDFVGPDRALAPAGSAAAADAALRACVPVWLAAGVGRMLPSPLWDAFAARIRAGGRHRPEALELGRQVAFLATPAGVLTPAQARARVPDCPVASELLGVN